MGGWHRLGSDDDFRIRQVLLGFVAGLVGLGFSYIYKCIMVDTIHMHGSYVAQGRWEWG
jgi:hypothetical protein